jgi:hypothetical protein
VAAFVLAGVTKSPTYFPARLLGWLLLSVGIAYAWAGFFHVVFPPKVGIDRRRIGDW